MSQSYVFGVTNPQGNLTRLISKGASEKDALIKLIVDNWDLIKQKGTIDLYGEMEGGEP
jgi:hypothetical protein